MQIVILQQWTPLKTDGEQLVLSERREAVLLPTLNRPQRMNAWNDRLEDSYFALLDSADADQEIRAVVLTGAGRGFCAGADTDSDRLLVDSLAAADVAEGVASFLERRPPAFEPLSPRR